MRFVQIIARAELLKSILVRGQYSCEQYCEFWEESDFFLRDIELCKSSWIGGRANEHNLNKAKQELSVVRRLLADKIDGVQAYSDKCDGVLANSDKLDGVQVDGEKLDGVQVDGEKFEGVQADGEVFEGEKADGEQAYGEYSEGEDTDDGQADGVQLNGEPTDDDEYFTDGEGEVIMARVLQFHEVEAVLDRFDGLGSGEGWCERTG